MNSERDTNDLHHFDQQAEVGRTDKRPAAAPFVSTRPIQDSHGKTADEIHRSLFSDQ